MRCSITVVCQNCSVHRYHRNNRNKCTTCTVTSSCECFVLFYCSFRLLSDVRFSKSKPKSPGRPQEFSWVQERFIDLVEKMLIWHYKGLFKGNFLLHIYNGYCHNLVKPFKVGCFLFLQQIIFLFCFGVFFKCIVVNESECVLYQPSDSRI